MSVLSFKQFYFLGFCPFSPDHPSLDYSPLCSLCLNLVMQLDPRKSKVKKTEEWQQVESISIDDQKKYRIDETEGSGDWNDTLAEQVGISP